MRIASQITDPGREAGFSALEAMAAIAILAIALLPLLRLQSELADRSIRMERQVERMSAERTARAYLRLQDFSQTAEGEMDIGGGWRLAWQTRPVASEEPARYGAGLPSRYMIQRIRVEASVEKQQERPIQVEFETNLIRERVPYTR